MKFAVSQSALSRALVVVAKGMANNASIPSLAGIYIKAEDGTLEFQTTDMTISIRHRIPANVEESGATVVSGRLLQGIVKTLPDTAVQFDLREGDRVVAISCGRSRFRLNTLPASDFPDFPEYELSRTVELPSALLADMVSRVYKVTSKDTSRPILQGVLLSVEGATLRLVATDSYRLAVVEGTCDGDGAEEAFSTIVPGVTFHDVLSVPSMTERIMVGTTESQVVFSFGNTTYISRKIEGTFPNYRQLLPQSYTTRSTLDVAEFSAALKRVSVVAQANPSVRLDVDADGQLVRLSASSPDQGESSEEVNADIEGSTMSIALNYHYVFDCVGALGQSKEVSLELQGPMQPGIFRAEGALRYLYLLMPVRI